MLQGGGWGKKGAVNCFQHWAPRLRLKTFPSIAEGYFVHPFTESWLVLNAPFSKWCPSGRLRDHPALAVSLTCRSPASCANPGYSSLPSGAWRPKEWVPSCSPPCSGGEEPTQELLPQWPGSRGAECFRETYEPGAAEVHGPHCSPSPRGRQAGSPRGGPALTRKQRLDTD